MFYPSITESRSTEPFGLQVSRNLILGHRSVIVFGFNPDVDVAEESVWPDGGVVQHPSSASILKVSSTSASDSSSGVGARTVYIEGINQDYDSVSEVVILNGQTAVNTQNQYRFINDLYVVSVGSSGHNVGDINVGTGTVTAGEPAILYDLIAATFNNRTTSHYAIPSGYTGYMTQALFTAGQASGSTSVTGKLIVTNDIDNISRVGAMVVINNGSVNYLFDPPLKITEKSCVGATAFGSANNNGVSTMFNIVLIKNEV
jgi:hypothetical protein